MEVRSCGVVDSREPDVSMFREKVGSRLRSASIAARSASDTFFASTASRNCRMATAYAAFSWGAPTSQGASGSSSFAEKLTFVVRGWTLTAPTNASP